MPGGFLRVVWARVGGVGRLKLLGAVGVHAPKGRCFHTLSWKNSKPPDHQQTIPYALSRHPIAGRNVRGPVFFIANGEVETTVLVVDQLVVSDARGKLVLNVVVEAREKGEAEVAALGHLGLSKADTIVKRKVTVDQEEVVGVRQCVEGADEGFVVMLRAARHV